jgi:ankyrin repeat protein
LYLSHLILKLLTDSTVKDFHLSSNDENFGIFDDVVVEIEYINGEKQIYAVQLKHVNKGKTLTKNGLAEKRGNFSISKYFEEWTKLRPSPVAIRFILFTNLKFDVPDGERIKLANHNFEVSTIESRQELMLGSHEHGRCYQFTSPDKYKEFFGQFYLYSNQSNVDKLKNDTKTKLLQMFNCEEEGFDKYLQFVTEWSLIEGKKDKLSKCLISRAIAVRLLGPYMRSWSFSGDQVGDNLNVLRKAMSQFQVTLFGKAVEEKVRTIWKDAKSKLEINYCNRIGRRYQMLSKHAQAVDDLNDEESTRLLWLMGLCPLPLVVNETVEKVIDACQDDKFVVIGALSEERENVFRKLSDLDERTRINISKRFQCSLQGRDTVTLDYLVKENCKILQIVTTNELVQMVDDPFNIGEKREILPIPHIDRILCRNIINLDFIDRTNDSTLIVIDNFESQDEQKIMNSSIKKIRLIPLKDFWTKIQKGEDESRKEFDLEICISRSECSPDQMDRLFRLAKNTNCHHFRMCEEGLEWIRSKGDIADLKEFRSRGRGIDQTELFQKSIDNRINIICADPGMGKSILMKNLKNSSKSWTVLVQPKDHSRYFRAKNTNIDDFIEYIVSKTYKNCDGFVRELVQILVEDCQIMFIWDGLDEVVDENLQVILTVIARLSTRGYLQWLTSRCNLLKTLESHFGVLSMTVEQFDTEQQNTYIEKRLGCSGDDLVDIKKKIYNCIRLVRYNDILGIPLQIYMFTELFRQNRDKYKTLLSNIFSITDLYRHFVDEKFNIYHQVKAMLDDSNDLMMQIVERSKNERLRHYEEAALMTYLKPEILDELRINCDSFLDEIQLSCDSVGIIVDVTEEKIPSFLHNSYGEYFAASYLSKNYRRVRCFVDFIFEESYNNIRFLFDLLLAEECPAHVAVLYKNLEVLMRHDDALRLKDKGGRSPLHLVCSWGKKFSTMQGHKVDNQEGAIEDTREYQAILNYLCERCDPLEVDDLFKMDAFHYGDSSNCLLPVLVLSNTHKFDFKLLKNFNDLGTILYNSVKLDYADVFEEMPFVKESQVLWHLAVLHKSINCLKKMAKNPNYKRSIDIVHEGMSPFLLACRGGNAEVVEILMEAGANTSATTHRGYSPIYVAAQADHFDLVHLLIDRHVDINAPNQFGQTALLLACIANNCDLARKLIELGADVNRGDDSGYTPLYMACRHKFPDVVRTLLDSGADVNATNVHGDLPLFMAAWNGQLDLVKKLVEAGADVNGVNHKGHGAVHATCINNHVKVLEYLIETGADVNAPNRFGQTPLHLALRHGFDAAPVLIEAGADITLVNRYGENFWDMATRCGHEPHALASMLVKVRGKEYWNAMKQNFNIKESPEQTIHVKNKSCNIL